MTKYLLTVYLVLSTLLDDSHTLSHFNLLLFQWFPPFSSEQWRLEKAGNLFKITKLLCARGRNQTQVYQSINPYTFSYSGWSPKGKGDLDSSKISQTKSAFLPEEVIAKGRWLVYGSRIRQDQAGSCRLARRSPEKQTAESFFLMSVSYLTQSKLLISGEMNDSWFPFRESWNLSLCWS